MPMSLIKACLFHLQVLLVEEPHPRKDPPRIIVQEFFVSSRESKGWFHNREA